MMRSSFVKEGADSCRRGQSSSPRSKAPANFPSDRKALAPARRTPALVSLAFFALAGCAVGPNYQKPATETPATYAENAPWKTAAPKDAAPRGEWWKIFRDPQLRRP